VGAHEFVGCSIIRGVADGSPYEVLLSALIENKHLERKADPSII